MTLQASGGMTIADINTELGRTSGAALSTSDTDAVSLALKSSGEAFSIPADFYGKAYIELDVTPGYSGVSYQYLPVGSPTGSCSPTSFLGIAIVAIQSRGSEWTFGQVEPFEIVLNGNHPSTFLPRIIDTESGDTFNFNRRVYDSGAGTTAFFMGDLSPTSTGTSPWSNTATKTLKLIVVP